MADLTTTYSNVFEKLKRVNEHGAETWSARELAKILEYSEFRHFLPVIARAKEACEKSGHKISDHFEEMLEMVEIGSGAQRLSSQVLAAAIEAIKFNCGTTK